MEKKYDITIFGATGFTGQLISEYLAEKMQEKPFSLGIAGRKEGQLKEMVEGLKTRFPSSGKIGYIVADSANQNSLNQMARVSGMIISTVGPYLKYGEPLIRACIKEKAHYLDITGEGAFVESMIQRYNLEAKLNEVKLINCCGYDSIPADLGTFFLMKQFNGKEPVEVECFISFASSHSNPLAQIQSFSGGTWHSAIGFMNFDEMNRQIKAFEKIQRSNRNRKIFPISPQFRFREDTKTWGAPLPFVDIEIVLRSAQHFHQYGPEFSYGHYSGIDSTIALFGWILGFGTLFTLAQIPTTKEILLSLRKPGEGPPKDVRDTNSFTHSFIARSPSKTVKASVKGGDPGYGDTSKMVSECALSLWEDNLSPAFGFLTPAMAFGDFLITRLEKIGMKFQLEI